MVFVSLRSGEEKNMEPTLEDLKFGKQHGIHCTIGFGDSEGTTPGLRRQPTKQVADDPASLQVEDVGAQQAPYSSFHLDVSCYTPISSL